MPWTVHPRAPSGSRRRPGPHPTSRTRGYAGSPDAPTSHRKKSTVGSGDVSKARYNSAELSTSLLSPSAYLPTHEFLGQSRRRAARLRPKSTVTSSANRIRKAPVHNRWAPKFARIGPEQVQNSLQHRSHYLIRL